MLDLFIDLIKVSIGVAPCLRRTPSADEWVQLFEMCQKQSLVGVCFLGIQKLQEQVQGPPELLCLKWMGLAAVIQQRNEVLNMRCADLLAKLSADGFRSCILKGQGVAQLYDDQLIMLRQCGDIDVWIDAERSDILSYVQRAFQTKSVREHHVKMKVFDDVEVEAHFKAGFIRNFIYDRRLQKFFHAEADACFSNRFSIGTGEEICVPTWKFDAIQLLVHIHEHLMGGGIGLRQIMDYYYLLNRRPESVAQVDILELKTIIYSCGLNRLCSALMWIMHYVFEKSSCAKVDWMIMGASEKDGRFLLEEIIYFGNFGAYDIRYKKTSRNSLFERFFAPIRRNMHLQRFAPWDWLMSPLWRLYYFGWRKLNGYN